ncbi:sulfite exporter TauE/SafE family protein [Sphingobacterium sp.]|uniref:sulfite exporter TauE/SafE family protein n=1 Tax=Sphingobacterium sp. TaxID=341027 RepID=UPI0028AC25EE|nr:sulfite exporter TauE/SafE family protein [Sphingobacterium sp.]
MEYLGYFASIGIGVSLGLIGGGGSILTVPVLVYLFHIDPLLATSYSLFIVGSTSAVGAIPYFRNNLVDFQTALYFGLPSIITVFLTRLYVIEAIPNHLFQIGSFAVSKNMGIMLLFAVLMLFAALKMIKGNQEEESKKLSRQSILPLVFQGAAVGLISGLVGAGGGFLIIPALIIFNQMPMKKAVGTSLLIIAANSLFGFIGKLDFHLINWTFLLTISGIAIAGILIGSKLSQKIDGKKLKPAFGWFVLLMGIVVIIQEISK